MNSQSIHGPECLSRRAFGKTLLGAALAGSAFSTHAAKGAATGPDAFRLRYSLASSMYGTLPLAEILSEVRATGAESIDLWPKPHGSQREEIESMGRAKFVELLHAHQVRLDIFTRYDLGPFKPADEIALARELGVKVIVVGGSGPVGLSGAELKSAVFAFVEKLKPNLALAEAAGIQIGIENHGKNLIDAPDSLRWLLEASPSSHLTVALAPYHLPQEPALISELIEDLGSRISVFYAWQYGASCMRKMPKDEELLQMPGRGTLDFTPLLAALKKVRFNGLTEVFMHPTPRGVPILDTASEVSAEINRGRAYLDARVAAL